jgi:hypothetical protein
MIDKDGAEFKDDADFLSKVRDTDATPEDVERFHSIIEKLTRKAELCGRMSSGIKKFRSEMENPCPDEIMRSKLREHLYALSEEFGRTV